MINDNIKNIRAGTNFWDNVGSYDPYSYTVKLKTASPITARLLQFIESGGINAGHFRPLFPARPQ